MNRTLGTIPAFALALVAADATALAQRTFVASYGSDANPCSIANPCRSFGAAIALTATNGEIIVLDAAGYGIVTVTKSVSIIAPSGIYAGVSVGSGANGVTINAPGIDVRLKGLTINGVSPSSGDGVLIMQAASVSIENCAISNLGQYGVESTASADVTISKSTLRSNGGGVRSHLGTLSMLDTVAAASVTVPGIGVWIDAGKATLTRALVAGNTGGGVTVPSTASPTMLTTTSSAIVGNGTAGIDVASSSAGAPAHADIARNTIVANGTWGIVFSSSSSGPVVGDTSGNLLIGHAQQAIIASGSAATARISGNSAFRNGTGMSGTTGAFAFRLGDNYVRDNTTDASNVTLDSPL
jgi:hypothetical protein